jgi:transcription antitermination protein NusB
VSSTSDSSGDASRRRHDERSDAREQSLMLLYEGEQRGVAPSTLLEDRAIASVELSSVLVAGVEKHISDIDLYIVENAKGWAIDRMPALDRAVLRIAIFELLYRKDTPVAVVIDEAVELAKRFSTDDSGRFVNGVLSAVARTVRPSEG